MKRIVAVTVVALALSSSVLAQRVTPSGGFVLNVDYAKFRNNDSSGYLEVYYGFYPRLVSYDFVNGQYAGYLQVLTRIREKERGDLLVNSRSVVPIIMADTSDAVLRSTLVSQAGYALPFGEYTLEVVVIDSLTPGRRDSVLLPFLIRAYATNVAASDIELCSNVKASVNKGDLFYKNSLEVMPHPTLVFGVSSHPMMFHYLEYYNLDPEQTYTIKTQVVAQDGKVVRESSRPKKFGVKNAVEAGTTNVSSIQSSRYRFRVTLADQAGNTITQSEKSFFIYNPHIQSVTPSAVSIKASELAGLTADELAEEFRKAQYVATDQEIKTFSQISSADGRREFLSKFWTEVEAGRLGRLGVQRMAYLQRAGVANERFRSMGREGWRSDRGRVFLLYAEPDEIERFPSSENSKPYEIWHYYGIENGVEFVFVDRSGFGDYILVHSSKRGELRDDQWTRFLQ